MKVVIAVDGSKACFNALDFTTHLPFSYTSKVTLLHVSSTVEYNEDDINDEFRASLNGFNHDIMEQGKTLLTDCQNKLHSLGINAETVMLYGSPAKEIVDYAEREKADLIVIGSRGLNPIQSFFLGSVSEWIIRHAPCSVLLHRGENTRWAKREKNTALDVAFGWDDSPSSSAALKALAGHGLLPSIQNIDFISCVQINVYYGMSHSLAMIEYWPKYKKTIEESLAAVATDFKKAHPELSTQAKVLESTDTADSLNEYAMEYKKDMIIVGSKEKNVLDRFLLGSVSNRLIHHAQCPILIAH